MNHSFDINVAKKYGVHAAVILNNLEHWIAKNKANNQNYFEGNYWTYNSKKAFADLFPYMTTRQIEYALKKLIDDGIIITGNFNKMAYDRTLWYAITKKGYCILQNCEMEETKMQNGNNEIVEPIPNNKPVIKQTNINANIKESKEEAKPQHSKFIKPTLEEVKAYCLERKNNIDAETFIDYYTANGWQVGKRPMKDWRAAVRTWEHRNKPKEQPKNKNDFDFVSEAIQQRQEEQAKNINLDDDYYKNLNF